MTGCGGAAGAGCAINTADTHSTAENAVNALIRAVYRDTVEAYKVLPWIQFPSTAPMDKHGLNLESNLKYRNDNS
jgi:hypothetical protein